MKVINRILALLICAVMIFNISACSDNAFANNNLGDGFDAGKYENKIDEIKNFVINKQMRNCETIGANFLHASDKNGVYSAVSANEWTSGFYLGLNYLCYEISGDEIFKSTNDLLLPQLPEYNKLGHDIGMVFSPSLYADYKLFGNESSKTMIVDAAEALALRFKENGGYIKAWDWGTENDYRMIIDTMYNLPILYRAYEITKDEKFYDVACTHAATAMTYLVRDDYTTAHTFIFDKDGNPVKEKTHQGYADSSCWARGQAWAIGGFAMAYKFTGNKEFLETALGLADKYTELSGDDLIPKWDLSLKDDESQPVDTSAAAIAANGFMEIYEVTGNEDYRERAYLILTGLYEKYSSKDSPSYQGLICDGVGSMPHGKNVSVSLIYGDYFFVELLSRFLGISRGYW